MMRTVLKLAVLASAIHLCVLQEAFAAPTAALNIEAAPLAKAAALLEKQAGLTIKLSDSVVGATMTSFVVGADSYQEALTQMLAGTGLGWAEVTPKVIEIRGVATSDSSTLGTLQVEGAQSSAGGGFGDLAGFGLGVGANGSSDPTATEGTGSLTSNGASVASKMPLSFKETPQTVSVITSEQFKQQNMANVSDALSASPGVTVALAGNNKPTFLSRGFQVETYQVDGGAPMQLPGRNTQLSTPDLSAYDHIEVLRGASALYGGAGDPSGVVNLQRKRPVDGQQVILDGSYGSWDSKRGQLDVSSPLGFDDRLRGRMVIAQGNNDFFYDDANREQSAFYGVLEADVTPDTLVRGGVRYQFTRDDSPNIVGLPRYQDGRDLKLSRSTSYSAPWAFTDEDQVEKFIQLEHLIAQDWVWKIDYTSSHLKSKSRYPEFSGAIASDRSGYFYQDNIGRHYDQDQTSIGSSFAGKFEMLGLKQSIVVGGDYSKVDNYESADYFVSPNSGSPINVDDFNDSIVGPFVPGVPDFGTTFETGRRQTGVYANAALELIKGFHVNAGLRESNIKSFNKADMSMGGLPLSGYDQKSSSSANYTRSLALVYDFTDTYSGYLSYADIITPNDFLLTRDGSLLPPERGKTYEVGLKATYFDSLNLSLAYFNTRKVNVAVNDGVSSTSFCCSRPGGEIDAEGVDFQLSGALTERWQVNAGYSYTETHYNAAYDQQNVGATVPYQQSQQPRHQFKLWTVYRMPGRLEGLEVSGGVRVESERGTHGTDCAVSDPLTFECLSPGKAYSYTQPTYTVADLRLGYRLDEHWELATSLTNVTDQRYYATAGSTSSGNYYGEPRKLTFSVRAQY